MLAQVRNMCHYQMMYKVVHCSNLNCWATGKNSSTWHRKINKIKSPASSMWMNFNSKSVCEMQNKGFSCHRHQIVLIFWSVLSLGVGYSPTQSCNVLKVNIKHPSQHFKIHLFGFSLSLLRICFHPQCEILFSAFNPGDVVILLAVEQTIALFTQHLFSLSPSTGMINISSSSTKNLRV